MFSALPFQVARRELDVVRERLGLDGAQCAPIEVRDSAGPGNVVQIEVESEHVTELFSGFGERGVRAELVAERVAAEAAAYLEANVPVGAHLADQLLLPLALAGGGSFRTLPPTSHTETQIEIIRRFLGRSVALEPIRSDAWHVEVS
jgi:RNA 3'-terminal phosphate cyclase (ATP)